MRVTRFAQYLMEHRLVDFAGMVTDATSIIDANSATFDTRYDYILVDEFQDLSIAQLKLIRALSGPGGPRLFCVGDDWQSIFSFHGAVVDHFVDFDAFFDTPTRTALTTNFRSPPSIVAAGNDLIHNNEVQIDKTVEAQVRLDVTPLLHPLAGSSSFDFTELQAPYVASIIDAYIDGGASPD